MRMRDATEHDVRDALEALGSTVAEVVTSLEMSSSGGRGARRLPGRCPISRYLKSCLPWGWSATVSPRVARVYPFVPLHRPIIVELPDAVRAFVLEFDSGVFPGLVDAA